MLIVTLNLEVLFKSLISTLGLAVAFRVIAECPEEGGHEPGAPIGCDMGGNSMLGEDMDDKELG